MVAELPAEFDTQFGTQFEGSVGLSGGQCQRLVFAPAFMRCRPLLMLLDEPTAALNPEAEQPVYGHCAATAKERPSRTGAVTVLVSHRFLRSPGQILSSSSKMAGSVSLTPTRRCWPPSAGTRRCSNCKPRRTGDPVGG